MAAVAHRAMVALLRVKAVDDYWRGLTCVLDTRSLVRARREALVLSPVEPASQARGETQSGALNALQQAVDSGELSVARLVRDVAAQPLVFQQAKSRSAFIRSVRYVLQCGDTISAGTSRGPAP